MKNISTITVKFYRSLISSKRLNLIKQSRAENDTRISKLTEILYALPDEAIDNYSLFGTPAVGKSWRSDGRLWDFKSSYVTRRFSFEGTLANRYIPNLSPSGSDTISRWFADREEELRVDQAFGILPVDDSPTK